MNEASSHAKTNTKHAKPKETRDLRQTATDAIGTTTESLRDFAGKAASGIEANPISALVGGLAIGAIAGAFVPRTEQETRLLDPVGQRLSDTAHGAIDAAKDTAKSELGILGFSRDTAGSQVSRILEGVLKAVSTAGISALTASATQASAATGKSSGAKPAPAAGPKPDQGPDEETPAAATTGGDTPSKKDATAE